MHVACYLNISKTSRAPVNLRLEGTVILKMPNKITKITVVRKLLRKTLLIGKTAWSHHAMVSNSDFPIDSMSIMCILRKCPLFGSRHCSAVTLLEKRTRKLGETLKLSTPFDYFMFERAPINRSKGSSELSMEYEMKHNVFCIYVKANKYKTHLKFRLSVMNNSDIPLESREFECYSDVEISTRWSLFDFFPSEVKHENYVNCFKKNSSVRLKVEAEMSFYAEFRNSQKFFSDSLSETSKTFQHSLKKDLERFFRSNRKGCDVILRCENKDLLVHKSLICCRSPVFSAMFLSDMKEKELGIVEMDDTDSSTLSRFIEFLYLGSVTDSTLDLDNAIALYAIAHKYSIKDLIYYSGQFLLLNMDCGNSDEMLQFADLYEDKSLKNPINFCFYHNHDQSD
ncbi:speckle-type POZ protein B [Trichonephila clavata]|uniref:Speckle-type POZ protein B n=1 Tax=Trichonephila clavata TaxID=2740835 RepID=A0A8X6FHN3_TRICU|nr:speckle-type POZ protein B [Trichonephila clavata]